MWPKSKRFRFASVAFTAYTLTGVIAYTVSPEHIDKLAIYMAATSIPVVGYILGDTFRKSDG